MQSVTISWFSYKELALKYHPDLKHDNKNKAYKTFCLIAEAFDVLYDGISSVNLDVKRNLYDQYG